MKNLWIKGKTPTRNGVFDDRRRRGCLHSKGRCLFACSSFGSHEELRSSENRNEGEEKERDSLSEIRSILREVNSLFQLIGLLWT